MALHDSLDEKILTTLEEGPQGESVLARRLSVSRTTVRYRLKRLCTQGVVTQKKQGKLAIWEYTYSPKRTRSQVQVFTDREFIRAYESLLMAPKGAIIYALQGKQALYDVIQLVPRQAILRIRKEYKKRHIVIKGILNKAHHEVFDVIDDKMLEAHTGNPLLGRVVTSKKFLGPTEMIAAPHCIVLVHIRKRRSVLIKDQALVTMFYEMMELLFDALEKDEHTYSYDANQLFTAALERRKTKGR